MSEPAVALTSLPFDGRFAPTPAEAAEARAEAAEAELKLLRAQLRGGTT